MHAHNLQVRIRSLPAGTVDASHFDVVQAPMPSPADGEVLSRTIYLSLDPYMRKRLAEAFAGRLALRAGDLMMGRTIGEVISSRDPRFRVGDMVLGRGGWQEFAVEPGSEIEAVPSGAHRLSSYLGVLGPTGITAWIGMVHVAAVQAGEQVLVSSAAGAVGSTAGQIARHLGANVVGIAGGVDKCAAVVRELGFAACVDYKSPGFEQDLANATARGVDVCFENVGGAVLDASLQRMNDNGRIALCGLMSQYHAGSPYALRNFPRLLDKSLQLTGFGINTNRPLHARARSDLRRWMDTGAIAQWETVTRGLAQAPQAFVAMLAGTGRGKHLVQCSTPSGT